MAKLFITVAGYKLNKLGRRLTSLMNAANQYPDSIGPDMGEEDHIDGILFALNAMDIPYQVHRSGEKDRYSAVEIAGRMFYVNGGAVEGGSQ